MGKIETIVLKHEAPDERQLIDIINFHLRHPWHFIEDRSFCVHGVQTITVTWNDSLAIVVLAVYTGRWETWWDRFKHRLVLLAKGKRL